MVRKNPKYLLVRTNLFDKKTAVLRNVNSTVSKMSHCQNAFFDKVTSKQ